MLRIKKSSVFFKILIIPVIASISMLASLVINTQTASRNRLLLEDASAMQFPLLQGAERNLVLLAKINETLSSAVTTGDDESLQHAADYAVEMAKDFDDAKLVAPKFATEIANLQLEFNRYYQLAYPLSASMVDGSADFSLIALRAKEMSGLYLASTSALEGFRDARLSDFTAAIEAANRNADDAITYALVVGAAAIVLLFGVAIPIALGIRKSIRSVVTSLKDIAQGDGDLTVRLKTSSNDEIGELVFWFNTFVDKLQDVIQQVMESVGPLSGLSSRLDDFVEEVLQSIENQNQQSDNVSQSATEIFSNVDEVSSSAHRATDMANQTVSFAQEGHKSLSLTVSSIEALAEDIVQSATTIGELERTTHSVSMVISVIKSIAEQTNLLALNAAIEAARAGAQGRGFAVVADEVRSLANKTQASTDEIQETISALEKGTAKAVGMMRQSTAKTEACVKNVNEAGRRFEAILEHIEMNRSLSLSITDATDTQGKLTTLLQQHADEISNGAKTSHTATSSLVSNIHALSELSQTLTSVSSQFKV